MNSVKVALQAQWSVRSSAGAALPVRLIELLCEIDEHGSLAQACKASGSSYRHAWNLVREAEALVGMPLLEMRRGKGSSLTALGQCFVWAQRRATARLSPMLETLAAELEAEIHRAMSTPLVPLRIVASHGFAVELLRERLAEQGVPVDWRYASSAEAAAALHAGACDVAGLHVPVGELGPVVAAHYAGWFKPQFKLVHLVLRRQGLMVAPGNPKKIYELQDLARPSVRFINRQPGSGSRLLLEHLLQRAGVDPSHIAGYEQGEFTHAAVAAYVGSGMADAAFGVETPARRFKLDFLPLQAERYFLACDASTLDNPLMLRMLAIVRSAAYRDAVQVLPGYQADLCGTIADLRDLLH